jgi:hypothetical protein
MRRILALVGALPLFWVGYALACLPDPGDPWFELIVQLNTKTVPKGFVLRTERIERTGARECVMADGTRFDGFSTRELAYLAKNAKHGDGRPAHIKLPKPETVKLEVYCDPQRYVTHGRLSYKRMDRTPQKWASRMELDLAPVGNLITTRDAGENLYIDRVEPVASFCTMSAERLFQDPRPREDGQTFGHASLSLAELAGARKHVGFDLTNITPADAAAVKPFEVYVDCYRSKHVITATVRYALNRLYVTDRNEKSGEACSRHQ